MAQVLAAKTLYLPDKLQTVTSFVGHHLNQVHFPAMKNTVQLIVSCCVLFSLLTSCGSKEKTEETAATSAPTVTEAATSSATTPPSAEITPTETAAASTPDATFDLSKVPVSSADLGQFPYLAALTTYEVNTLNSEDYEFERAYVYDGKNLVPIEGKVSQRLIKPKDSDRKASELMIRRNYESLLKDLGGTKVFSGKVPSEVIEKAGGYNAVYKYGKWSISTSHETDAYVIRQEDKEVWVQVTTLGGDGNYNLTVIERAPMPQQATIIKADELKKN
jgi:hypothetical protein